MLPICKCWKKAVIHLQPKKCQTVMRTLVLRCFMQNLDEWTSLSSVFHNRLKSHELGFPYEIVVNFKSPTLK